MHSAVPQGEFLELWYLVQPMGTAGLLCFFIPVFSEAVEILLCMNMLTLRARTASQL